MSVNTTAGFSIVTYTGTGNIGTFPHGLVKKLNGEFSSVLTPTLLIGIVIM